jgi:hypothetical protein
MAFVRLHPWLAILAVLGVTLWVYWGALAAPFQFDDTLFLQSSRVTAPEGLLATFDPSQLRQFTYLTFHVNYRLAGDKSSSYHLVNLLLHGANARAEWMRGFGAGCRLPQPPSSPCIRFRVKLLITSIRDRLFSRLFS